MRASVAMLSIVAWNDLDNLFVGSNGNPGQAWRDWRRF